MGEIPGEVGGRKSEVGSRRSEVGVEELEDVREVFVVNTAVDDVEVAMWGVVDALQHGTNARFVVGGLADGEGTLPYLLPTTVEMGVGDDAGEAAEQVFSFKC